MRDIYVDFDEDNQRFGFKGVALTATPANTEFWIAMSAIKLFLSEDKQMLYGPLLIPEQRIKRHSKELGFFNVVFSKEVIAKLARSIHMKEISFNYEHNPAKKVNGQLQEVWLTGNIDKSNELGYKLPEGSLFGGVYIKDKDFWNSEIKSGNVKGFSPEANMELLLTQINMADLKLSEVVATDGTLIKTDAEMFEKGTTVYTMKDDAKAPVPAGEYDLGNGTVIVVDAESKISEVKETANAAETLDVEMTALLSGVLKPFKDEIAVLKLELSELKVKVENAPAPAPAPAPTKKPLEVKMSANDIIKDWQKRKAELIK